MQERLAVGVREAAHMTSLGTTKIFKMLGTGQLTRVKAGRRTLVTLESLRRLVAEQR